MTISETVIKKYHRTKNQNHQFSILIPSWNNLLYLQLCIKSIKKNSVYPHQIIVHVNEGTDGTIEWIQQQQDIDYTFSNENIGICYALNYAATISHTDYILFMNDDMYVCPDWDAALMKEVQSIGHKYFFLSSTMIEPYNTNNPCVIYKNYGTNIESFNEDLLLCEFSSLKKDDWSGATWPPNIIHKDVWNAVGGYSIEFHPGMYSDPDFSMKLWSMGIRLFKGLGESKVYHFSGISTGRVKKNKGYYTFIQKWGFTSGYIMKYFLQRGRKYEGLLHQPIHSTENNLKNLFKRVIASFKK
jgi:glycosyltransferase involved in cell wall biosynthesis